MRRDGGEDIAAAVDGLKRKLPAHLENLAVLAYNYWWSWTIEGPQLFDGIDPLLWRQSDENPVRLLEGTPSSRLNELASDAAFVAQVNALVARMDAYLKRPDSPNANSGGPTLQLCAEFGVHNSLPIYAGGLGVLMGDLLKEASDQAIPTIGLGVLYWQGSFHQRLDLSGWQHEYWLDTAPQHLPAAIVHDALGKPLTVVAPARGHLVVLRIWRVDVGRVPLYLLDANHAENSPADRWITSRLYIGDQEMRFAQYAVLGIGGIRALRAMEIDVPLIHLNEGHAALAGFELIREGIEAGRSLEAAVEDARERTIFTTHTPVPAGHDTFPADDVTQSLDRFFDGLNKEKLLALARVRENDASEPFGTTPLALRLSRAANGVSRRHGEVSRSMWAPLWPDRPESEVPISHITNGVHLGTWMAPAMQHLLDQYLPRNWRTAASDPETWSAVDSIPDEEIWAVRCQLRKELVRLVREQSILERLGRGEPASYAESAAQILDDGVLTLGFVRRIATYKRLYLLTLDVDRGLHLLAASQPVQLVIAGKAHPQDEEAKRTVQSLFALNRHPGVAGRAVFLEDLDLQLEPYMVRGCDLWINLPRPPNEASGTSGMKSVLNGGLQLSILDGWWAEAYDGSNGWAIETPGSANPFDQDAHDAAALYALLENEVVPLFHALEGGSDLPRAWVQKVKQSLRTLAPRFNASRMVKEYVEMELTSSTNSRPR
jgi:glycogen phosphorylase